MAGKSLHSFNSKLSRAQTKETLRTDHRSPSGTLSLLENSPFKGTLYLMPTYTIRGIDVDFPFEAYDCQIVYMEKVIQSLQEGCNALLESPTGTGKTMCLLCATLAWRKTLGNFSTGVFDDKSWSSGSQSSGSQPSEHPRSNLPVIVYASRTHSQLKQVIRELKKSNYRPKMAVLGSREQMCIHDEVRLLQGRAQNNACHYLCKKHSCRHHSRVSAYMKTQHELGNEPFDIEDLVNIGRTKGPCPYYLSRELHKVVDVLFAPYNYLIDPGNRRSLMGIQWSNSVLIFDEAHNLESICADAASFDLPSGYLSACIFEAKQCIDLCVERRAIEKSDDKHLDPNNYAILNALLMKLQKQVAEVAIQSKDMGFTRPGHYIYDFLSELNITYETANMLINTIDNAALLLEEGNMAGGIKQRPKGIVCRLENIRDILQIIFQDGHKSHAKDYRFHVQESRPSISDSSTGKVSRTLSWWCFNPGLAMKEFTKLGVRSIILTSGTLSPLDSFALELNLHFPVRLENPHVVSANQVWVGVVPSGPSGYLFNSSYKTRDSLEYKQELGNAIVNFARIIPDGLLVFFPSYYLMDQCIECWKRMGHASSTDLSTIWERICRNKQPVIEPKQSALFPHAIEDFEVKLRDRSNSGAIFFAVCRGKVSEGLDFADQAGRAVVITGMPFSMLTDPKVRLKREYLDQQALSQKKDSKLLTGEDWYVQQAARAVNQAVGRVIRHKQDYGAIIFCDERFAQQNRQCQMSFWLRPYVKCYPSFGDVVFTLRRFFRDKGSYKPVKPKAAESLSSLAVSELSGKNLLPTSDISNPGQGNSEASQDKLLSADTLATVSLSGVLAATRGNLHEQMGKFVPANRSCLSYSVQSEDQLCFQDKLKANEVTTESSWSWDNGVVDLTNDESSSEEQRTRDVMRSCSLKKTKVLVTNNGVAMIESNDSSEKMQNNSLKNLRQLPSAICLETPQKQQIKHPSCGPLQCQNQDVDRKRQHAQVGPVTTSGCYTSTKKTALGSNSEKNEISGISSPDGKESKGSAFLTQVQEKLSAEEYREFVGLMKALKSKTMKVIPVLDSISKLFSAPGRRSLLERFKEFVPAKFRPMYEQLLRGHDAADSSWSQGAVAL